MYLARLRKMNPEDQVRSVGEILWVVSVLALIATTIWEHHRMSVAQCYDSYPSLYSDDPICTSQFSLTQFSGWGYWTAAAMIGLTLVLAGVLVVLALGYLIFHERWGLSLYSTQPRKWLRQDYFTCMIVVGAIDLILALIYVSVTVIASP